MVEKKIVIDLQHGLQARNATELVQKASSFSSEINLIKNGGSVAAKSIMGIMALAIRKGEEITLIADGSDEHQAVIALETVLLNKE